MKFFIFVCCFLFSFASFGKVTLNNKPITPEYVSIHSTGVDVASQGRIYTLTHESLKSLGLSSKEILDILKDGSSKEIEVDLQGVQDEKRDWIYTLTKIFIFEVK